MVQTQHRHAHFLAALMAFISLAAVACGPQPTTGPGVIDPDAPEEFTTTESGLKYRILRKSDRERPKLGDEIMVDYSGWLDNGTTFDSSYNRAEPSEFALRGVIPGWTEGMQLIGVGGMIELEVPPELGYGEAGSPPDIPPNSTLHFKIELLKIK